MSSKSLVFLCLIVKVFFTNASIIPDVSSTNGKFGFILLASFLKAVENYDTLYFEYILSFKYILYFKRVYFEIC